MNYEPLKGVIQITPNEARQGALNLLCAIRNIKRACGLPLTPYKQEGALSFADHAMHNILEAGEHMGMDLGARWGNEIDSTNHL